MKLSDYVVSFLAGHGVRHVFQVIGGASVHMVNSLAEAKNIEYFCVQHEQAGAMAAEAYSRMTKKLGAAMATSGPGMTNLITGIACAFFDSTPVFYITGQVNTFESKQGRKVRQVGFQETDIAAIVAPITKFAKRVKDPKQIRYILEKAFVIATSGRPGPILIDIPLDIQQADIDPNRLLSFNPDQLRENVDSGAEIRKNVTKAMTLLSCARRPVIIAGGGVRYSDQIEIFEEFVDKLGIPVVATWSGIDVLHHDHPLYIGQIGVYGSRAANFTIQNSDCILSFGSRLDTRITGGKPQTFGRAAKKIVVDIDRAELYKNRGLTPDIGICADLRNVLPEFMAASTKSRMADRKNWIEQTQKWKIHYPAILPKWRKRKQKVDPYVFIEMLSYALGKNAITVTDCGANLSWTIQAFHVRRGQRLFSAMGNSPMAYALPAAIGASMACGKKEIICIIGDGGLQMNIQELETLVHYGIPVKIFILNNHSYGIIKQFQDVYFNGRYEATTPRSGYGVPDFIKIAKAYGLATATIKNHREMKQKIIHVLRQKRAVICDVLVPDDAKIIPKLEFGKPIEELSPELPRDEFLKNILI
ncbi:thiamine pyrophosphate-binding protein [Candidatus Gottesmanbacteria bacterium]|nr:thiamine pyrophosphate-binding protein [Candidatus Gottesmanbacteria bacterium]